MTRAEIYSHISENLGEYQGTTGEASRMFAYPKLVTDAADKHARATGCYWKVANTPIIANQALYCAPQIIEWVCCTVFDTSGNVHLIDSSTEWGMDEWGGSSWRNNTSQPLPNTIINQGLNQLLLSPTPNYNSTVSNYTDIVLGTGTYQGNTVSTASSAARPFVNALAPDGDVNLFLNFPASTSTFTQATGITSGWYRIVSVDAFGVATLITSAGTSGSTGAIATLTSGGIWIEGPGVPGDGSWDALTAQCPLPDRAHMGVMWEATLMRAIRVTANIPDNVYNRIQQQRDDALGKLERETRRVTWASRVPALIGANDWPGRGAWDSTYGNPLDL